MGIMSWRRFSKTCRFFIKLPILSHALQIKTSRQETACLKGLLKGFMFFSVFRWSNIKEVSKRVIKRTYAFIT